jgi:cyclopropane fatty-acyl-phospholipid synthase-like methyltransferase
MTEPNHIDTTIQTYDRIAPDYGLTDVPELRAWKERSMDEFTSLLSGMRVLVPGCGHGRDSAYLRRQGLSVVSADLSSSMLREARSYDPGGEYVLADMRDIADIPGDFDGIFANGCLYHLTTQELVSFLSDVRKKLTPRGVLYVSMKLGTGSEMKSLPGTAYPGGEPSRAALVGPRFYQYYQHDELMSLFSAFELVKWQPLTAQKEGVNEYWLRLAAAE